MEGSGIGLSNEDTEKITSLNPHDDKNFSTLIQNGSSLFTTNEVSNTTVEKCVNYNTFMSRISRPFLGLFYTFLCSLFMTLSSVIVKKMTYISPGQLSLVRNASVFAFCFPIAVFGGKHVLGPKKHRLLLLGRGFLGATALYLHVLTYRLLPLAEASIILSTLPVVAMILARLYLKERCGIVQFCSLIFTILGVFLSVRIPELIKDSNFNFTIEYIMGLASGVGCVFCLAVALVCIRKMKDVHYSVILIYMGLVGVVENGGLTAAFSIYKFPRCGWDPILMMFVGVFGWLGNCFITLAIQTEAVGNAAVMRSCLDIVVAFVLQVLFFGNPPDAYNGGGAIIVIIAVSAIGVSKWLLQLPEDSKTKKKFKYFLQ